MSQVDYGKALRVARAARGMSQRDLARAASVSPSYASYVEAGKRRPSPEALELLSAALQLPPWALVYLGSADGHTRDAVDGEVMRLLQG